jgi:hypothetical protein
MMTPGALGAITMVVTNSIAPMIAIDRRWTGLALAFLFGSIALVKAPSLFEKAIYYIINSFIIFSVAAGTNQVGVAVTQGGSPSPAKSTGWLLETIAPSALAANFQPSIPVLHDIREVQFFQSWLGTGRGTQRGPTPAVPTTTAPAPTYPLTLNPDTKNWDVLSGNFKDMTTAQDQAAKLNEKLGGKYEATVTDQHGAGGGWSVLLKRGLTLPQALDAQQDVMVMDKKTDTYLWNPDKGIAIGKPEG